MQILLPPSETKLSGGGSMFAAGSLSHSGELGTTRQQVRKALETLSRDEEAAAKALKLGVKVRGEIAHNRVLDTSGTMPAIERYTGVLYDALAAQALSPVARSWVDEHVSIQSALFGLISAADEIPAYRLSASSRLPDLAAPLKRVWQAAHAEIAWQELGWVLDMRSSDYVELAPLPAGVGVYLQVVEQGEGGVSRALNHFNKAAKGKLVRVLAESLSESDESITSASTLIAWGARNGVKFVAGEDSTQLSVVVGGAL